jgi:hypothetical protein
MYQITIPESRSILFESILEPNPGGVNKLRKNFGASEYMIEGFRGKKNRIAVGQLYRENLISRMQSKNEEISYEIKRLAEKYDFHFVALNCVFQPDIDCKFEWARFGVELYAVDSRTGDLVSISSPPTSYSLFPDSISSEIKVKRGFGITPELKFNMVVEAGVSGSMDKTEEYIFYEPQITSFGLNTSKVAWDFRSSKERAVLGDKKLQLVIQTPKGTKVKGKFLLGAEVSSSFSKWLPVPVSKRKDNAVETPYELSE